MKFITKDGTIAEGVAITDRQATLLDRLEAYLHEKMCDNRYHGIYGKKPCRDIVNEIVPKLDDSSAGSLLSAIFEPEPEPISELDPTPVSQVETLTTSETTSQPTPESLPASTASTKDDLPF